MTVAVWTGTMEVDTRIRVTTGLFEVSATVTVTEALRWMLRAKSS